MIVKAKLENYEKIYSILIECRDHMQNNGINQWDAIYPDRASTQKAIEQGTCYKYCMAGNIIGSICMDENQDPEYQKVSWLSQKTPHLVIHRLAIRPPYQSGGIGKQMIAFAESYAQKHNYSSIRLDGYSANIPALKLYTKMGFQKTGEVYFARRDLPFYCYEKLI